ncbi:MAG: hypothetical protein A2161_01375 [Candidatus Schekmanbacteria bacterium RBG_13_48_7]|uniref:Uncharacterized protein n=1 Tax=Candidatus Schekmanbacteria bacterium RBG_13_48_7 TaxID=1817878 RepID=A0A1F7RNQ3_9BACT|nr:MAG: hypothetical protein A2161_01375 [Candidatus Schekmanbacteria bacterium RBG_13_48_7]
MKLIKKKLVLFALFSSVFTAGCLLGMKVTSHIYNKCCFSQILDHDAIALASKIDTVCQLRLGQVGVTIDLLEKGIDWNIVALAQAPNIREGDYRYNILRAAKTYRAIFPSHSLLTDIVDDALSDIKKIESFEYDTPLCCLVRSAGRQKNL